jgi:hypothetical protein
MRGLFYLAALALAAATAAPAAPPKPLFASDQPIRITIQGPISTLVSKRAPTPVPATLVADGVTYPITLAPRGITRLQKDTCQFPPLRVEFTRPPPAGSLFQGQHRLKLVTHCKNGVDFQQKVLLEYSAYRIYNLLTQQSFRARLANVDYVDADGKPFISRIGFFLEDFDDVAKRNGMRVAHMGPRVPLEQIDATSGGRFAVFEYLISNYDWSMRAGPEGDECCHNGRLMSLTGGGILTPVPYDFDFSGLVDAPYAGVPEGIPVATIKERNYRGYCAHMVQARAAAAGIAARRGEVLGVFQAIPGLSPGTSQRAAAFIAKGIGDIDSGKIFKNCSG